MPEAHTVTTEPTLEEANTNLDSRDTENDILPKVTAEPPFTVYEEMEGSPYTAKFFEIGDYADLNDFSDMFGVREGVNQIEGFIRVLIDEQGLDDSIESYEKIMDDLFEKLDIKKGEKSINKILKISKYIDMINKNKSRLRETISAIDDKKRDLYKRLNNM